MSDHLGERLTALVDGALDHAERERVLAHLAHCSPCRGEVDAHRRLKSALGGLRETAPLPSPDLTARLLAVAAARARRAGRPARHPPPGARSARRPPSPRRAPPACAPRRTTTAGVLLVAGLVGALALGAPASSGPAAPVDPASPALVADHVSTSSGVPLSEPAVAGVVDAGLAGPGR